MTAKHILILCSPLIYLFSCGQSPAPLKPLEAWDGRNAPEIMGYDDTGAPYTYNVQLSALPLSGALTKTPWSGDYWPSYRGGITYRWADVRASRVMARFGYDLLSPQQLRQIGDLAFLSPAEKKDVLLGRYDWPSTLAERARTQVMKTVPHSLEYLPGFSIARWQGLCHAWAPATLFYENPGPVTLTTEDGLLIPFGAADVKALLTHFVHTHRTKSRLLGARCNLDFGALAARMHNGEISYREYRAALNRAECRDTNAGSFHIVLTNQIGLMNEGFIADVTTDYQVWNQAVHGFRSRIVRERLGASIGAAPGTVREVDIQTMMTYTVEIQSAWERSDVSLGNRTIEYNYRLELNHDGEIIGGDWFGNGSNEDRPDFLWKLSRPVFGPQDAWLENLYLASITNI